MQLRVASIIGLIAILASSGPARAQANGTSASPDWSSIVAAARQEGRVTFYGSPSPQVVARLAAGFRKAYPEIAIETFRASTGEVMARIDQERAAGIDGADVWLGAERNWFLARAKEGRLLKPDGPGLNGWPARATLDGAVITASLDPSVITYNARLAADPPASYADFLKPEFKGKLGATDASSTAQLAWYVWLDETNGGRYLEGLKAQGREFYVGGPQAIQALASGEVAAVVGLSDIGNAKTLIDQGAPLVCVVTRPSFATVFYAAAFSWSRRPNAARVLLDYLMSPQGQAAYHGTGESASPRPGIAGAVDSASVVPFDPDDYPHDRMVQALKRWKAIFSH